MCFFICLNLMTRMNLLFMMREQTQMHVILMAVFLVDLGSQLLPTWIFLSRVLVQCFIGQMPFLTPASRNTRVLYCVEWDVKPYYTIPITTEVSLDKEVTN